MAEHPSPRRPRLAHWLVALLIMLALRMLMPWVAAFS